MNLYRPVAAAAVVVTETMGETEIVIIGPEEDLAVGAEVGKGEEVVVVVVVAEEAAESRRKP